MEASKVLRVNKDVPTLRELTAESLRNAILSLHFKPGDKLNEREICEQTGVSRTSVREALRHLESEGLIEPKGSRGFVVSTVTKDGARQIYEVRAALEACAARYFTKRATKSDIQDLRTALADLETSVNGNLVADYVEKLDRIYEVLLRGSGNEVCRNLLGTLSARINYMRIMTAKHESGSRRKQTVKLMNGIVRAAAKRNSDDVARRCEEFAERSSAFALDVLSKLENSEDGLP